MSPLPGELSTGYRPRPATNDLKEIVEDSLEELFQVWDVRFQESYGSLPARVRELFERFLRCGDLHFGFLRLRCVNPKCPEKMERLIPFSCRSRGLCPSCGQRRALEWAERMVEEVLPLVPYRHLTFTIPISLRKSFLSDRSLYGDLCRVAYASTRDLMQSNGSLLARQGKAVPAMIVSPQSFGDLLVPNAHAHSVVSLGLFRKDGIFFPMEELDFSGLEEIFRERFFQMLLRREKILPETVERFKSWDHSGFNVGWERKFEAGDRKGLEGLLSYMERPAVSLRRLTYRNDGRVHYRGTKLHPRLGIDHQLLTPVEFLALLVPHVLLKYQITLRLYGALSTTFRRNLGWISNPPVNTPPQESLPAPEILTHPDLNPPPSFPQSESFTTPPTPTPTSTPPHSEADEDPDWFQKRKRSWAKLIYKAWCDNPEICRSCGKSMKIIEAIAPEQEDVIERILRYLKLWDPPWKRQRKARGPPPSSGQSATSTPLHAEAIDHIIDDELYAMDPFPQEDDDTRA